MRRFLPLLIVALAVTLAAHSADAAGRLSAQAQYYAPSTPWHGGYYHTCYGTPVALVVSPKAELQTNWGWGVGNTRVTPIWRQFRRNYPGPAYYDAQMLQPTPPWPSDTNQFGVYYVRGPW